MTDHPDVDRLIGDVARDLTAGDPPAHLRTRVMARLDERRASRWPWLAAVACAAGVAVAVMLTLRDRPAPPPLQQAHHTQSKPVHESQASIAPTAPPHIGAVRDSKTHQPVARRADPATQPSPELVAWQADAVPALESPIRLILDSIQPAPLEIRPLDTAPLTVPALNEESR